MAEIDRENWPSGPWDDEPDELEWRDPSTQLICHAARNLLGAWCGYVGVNEDHPFTAWTTTKPWVTTMTWKGSMALR